MYFRFGAAIVLVVVISVVGVALEKRCLSLRRDISRQQMRMDVLVEQHAKLRLEAQRLGAPARTLKSLEANGAEMRPPRAAHAIPNVPLSLPSSSPARPQRREPSETL